MENVLYITPPKIGANIAEIDDICAISVLVLFKSSVISGTAAWVAGVSNVPNIPNINKMMQIAITLLDKRKNKLSIMPWTASRQVDN